MHIQSIFASLLRVVRQYSLAATQQIPPNTINGCPRSHDDYRPNQKLISWRVKTSAKKPLLLYILLAGTARDARNT